MSYHEVEVRYEDNGLSCEYYEMRRRPGKCSGVVIGSAGGWLLCEECMALTRLWDSIALKDDIA